MPKAVANRMGWIRHLEEIEELGISDEYSEHEFASECRITGQLVYAEGAIVCAPFTLQPDGNGLYRYLLRLRAPVREDDPEKATKQMQERMERATKKGYSFKEGMVGELLALIALRLQCRFYLLSTSHGNSRPDTMKWKFEHPFRYLRVARETHPKIFDDRPRNFARDLPDFLDSLRGTGGDRHQQAMLACYHYARALREVGIDAEMVFVRLVSAIEVLAENHRLRKKDNPIDGVQFDRAFAGATLSDAQRVQLREVLEVTKKGKVSVRKTSRKFVSFIEEYSAGALKGGNYKARHLKITRKDLPAQLRAIYRARSRYLHAGEPMYLSQPMAFPNSWDVDPSFGMIIDNRRVSGSDKLPYSYWFEDIVRHCLLNYLEKMG